MKNLFLIFLLPLLAFTVTSDWEMVSMDEQATVIFPVKPTYNEQSGNKVWTAEIDSASRCTAMFLDFEKYVFDSTEIKQQFNTLNALEEFKKGLLNKMEGATLIAQNEKTEGGVTCFEFMIEMGKEAEELNYMYNKSYFVGTKMYALTFYQLQEKKDEVAERFFKSFKVKEM